MENCIGKYPHVGEKIEVNSSSRIYQKIGLNIPTSKRVLTNSKYFTKKH
jgi:hypothetical protein